MQREGVRLFGVGGVGSELVEWEWGGPGSGRAVGMVKVRRLARMDSTRANPPFHSRLCRLFLPFSPSPHHVRRRRSQSLAKTRPSASSTSLTASSSSSRRSRLAVLARSALFRSHGDLPSSPSRRARNASRRHLARLSPRTSSRPPKAISLPAAPTRLSAASTFLRRALSTASGEAACA